jgi:hypothetical protein
MRFGNWTPTATSVFRGTASLVNQTVSPSLLRGSILVRPVGHSVLIPWDALPSSDTGFDRQGGRPMLATRTASYTTQPPTSRLDQAAQQNQAALCWRAKPVIGNDGYK